MFGSLSAHKRQTWFWVAVAVVLSIAAFVFHLLSIHRENIICSEGCFESDNEWAICRQIILFAFAAATLLLLTIAGYSQFHIRKHPEYRFKDVFSQTFHHYWVYYILFILLMTVVSVVWACMCSQALDNHPVYLQVELRDALEVIISAPLKEEAMYRLLPFLIAIIPMARVKAKRWRIALGCFFGLMILCVQMQFGYAHLEDWLVCSVDSTQSFLDLLKVHVLMQGGVGVFCAITFGVVLFVASKTLLQRQVTPNTFKALLYAIPFAYLSSTSVHLLYNLCDILSRTSL